MAEFIVQEVKEIVIKTTIDAPDAETALSWYKSRIRQGKRVEITNYSEETHITVYEAKEENKWQQLMK
jgi:translation initiation factor IF-3